MKTTLALIACLGLILTAPAALASAKFYKWTDAQGGTHYTEDPPPDSAKTSTRVKVPTRQSSDNPPAAPAKAGDKKAPVAAPAAPAAPAAAKKAPATSPAAAKKADKVEEKSTEAAGGPERYAEKCQGLQAKLQTMQEHARVKVTDANGESRVLEDDEKNAQIDDIQRQIKAYCQ